MEGAASELRLTYALLFGRNEESKAICEQLFKQNDIQICWLDPKNVTRAGNGDPYVKLSVPKKNEIGIVLWEEGRSPNLQQFQLFRVKLAILKDSMVGWKPQKFADVLYQPGYFEKFTYFTGLVGVGVAVLTFILGPVSIVQLVISIIMAKRAET